MSSDQLLKAAEELSSRELEEFVAGVLTLRAKRKAPSVSAAAADLLLRINQGIPVPLQQRYLELIKKRQAETLTPDEHEELLQLTAEVEAREARRAEALAELARLRQTSLGELMKSLEMKAPAHG